MQKFCHHQLPRVGVFYRLIDAIIQGLACRFDAVKRIDDLFGFLYKYNTMTEVDLLMIVFQQLNSRCV